jgi:hypothetical protein
LEIAGDRVDLGPHVDEAIRALGFIRADAFDWLTREIALAANKNGGRTIRESGRRLDNAERAALGITGRDGHLSREVWDALTDKGRQNPVAAFDDTCARTLRGARNEAQRSRDRRVLGSGRVFDAVKMGQPPGTGLCAAGMDMVGKILDEPPILPLPGCDRTVCGCSWRLVKR